LRSDYNRTQGGLKAVVWTDTLQTIVMFSGVVIIMVLGTAYVGGLDVVFDRSAQSGRLEFFKLVICISCKYKFKYMYFASPQLGLGSDD
jgi:Na+/proline symporter